MTRKRRISSFGAQEPMMCRETLSAARWRAAEEPPERAFNQIGLRKWLRFAAGDGHEARVAWPSKVWAQVVAFRKGEGLSGAMHHGGGSGG